MSHSADISFAPAREGDFDYFYALRKETMLEHFVRAGMGWDEADQRQKHRDGFNIKTMRIINYQGRRIGCVNVGLEGQDIVVSQFSIETASEGRGIGTAVMELLMREFVGRKMVIDVLIGNRANRLYKRLGFQPTASNHPLLLRYFKPLMDCKL